MKGLVIALTLAALGAVAGVVFLWPAAPRTGPEPIAYGRDVCAHCRMHLSQPGFAGEVRSHDGTLTKYDDLGCMLLGMLALHQQIPEAWVEDHGSGRLVPLLGASLVRGERVETPMGYGIVAFEDAAAAGAFAAEHGGRVVTLEQILADKALRPSPTHAHAE